jgi:hypothetical protein
MYGSIIRVSWWPQDRNIGIPLTLEYRFARVTNKQKEAPEEAHATDPRMHL